MPIRADDFEHITTEHEEFLDTTLAEREGLAIRYAAKPESYANGITEELQKEGIVPANFSPSDLFSDLYVRHFEADAEGNERQDVILLFPEDGIDAKMGNLALWRVDHGFCKWVSDYRHQEQTPAR
jgi:hypothetical protein